MREDLLMLLEANIERFSILKLREWREDIPAFHPELAKTFACLEDTLDQDVEKVIYGGLFPLESLHGIRRRRENCYRKNGTALYGSGDFYTCVFDKSWTSKWLEPLEIAEKIVPKLFANERHAFSEIDLKTTPGSECWPRFHSTRSVERSWVAVRHLSSLSLPPPKCPTCGHREDSWESYSSSDRLVVAIWGIGKQCLDGGYIIVQTSCEGKPFKI